LSRVTGFLYALQSQASTSGTQEAENHAVPPVAHVEELNPHPTRRTWGTATFLIPEFSEINECAYFDSQRDRVFIRTSKTLARSSRRRKKAKAGKPLPLDQHIDFTPKECPHCQSKEIIPFKGNGRRKVLYDLKFTSRGITRRVIECLSRAAHCAQCSAVF